jgi:hypothetical protein
LRRWIGVISPHGESEPASNGGRRVNTGVVLAQVAMLLLMSFPAWKVTDRWRLSPGYAFEQIHLHLEAPSQDTSAVVDDEGTNPVHSAQLRSHVDLVHGISWDVSGYFFDRLKSGGAPAYTRLDTGLTWRWAEALSMTVVGQDLWKDRHVEFVDDSGSVRSTLIKRSIYGKVTWQF